MTDSFLVVVIVIYLMGSAVYIYNPAISGTNLIAAFLIPFILYSISTQKRTMAGLVGVLGFGLMVLFSMIAVILDSHYENFRMLRSSLVASASVWGAAWVTYYRPKIVPKALYCSLIITALIAIFQITYLKFGIGINPARSLDDEAFYTIDNTLVGVPSIFGNPNDFSVFACFVFIYFFVKANRPLAPIILSLFCILISGSKTGVFVILLGMLLKRLSVTTITFVIIAISIYVIYLQQYGFEGTGIYFFDRFIFTFSEILSGSLDVQSSASIRFETWAYFLREYPRFLFGTFTAGSVFPQFSDAQFDTSLIALNPHSFIIELHALFGFGGLLISVMFLFALRKSMTHYHGLVSIYVYISILILTNVSSSIFGSGSTFALIAILALNSAPATWVTSTNSFFRTAS